MRGRPKTVNEKRIQLTVRTKPLGYDPEIIKSLGSHLTDNGWSMHPEDTTLMWKHEGRRVIYIRRHNLLQCYWAGYGAVSLERLVADFDTPEEILQWIQELEELTLPSMLPYHEPLTEEDLFDDDDLESMSTFDIISQIFNQK